MAVFYQALNKLVNEGLAELQSSVAAGKTPNNPVSETHFMSAWITKVIKQQRYDHCVAKTLLGWQQMARSMGKQAQLKLKFEHLAWALSGVLTEEGTTSAVKAEQLDALYSALQQLDWVVATEYEVNRKVTHHTDGQASLVVCAMQFKEAFDEAGVLVKPLSVYVRGNTQQCIDLAYQQGLLLYKVTDYKSLVKYHGEYLLYPDNAGDYLPELPTRTAE
ncbi:DUF2913 family protein [Photobacterium halotolerans]|uniref:DUF2913 family protein n=1 Tax=Photobacterium halotolerans TaxID=265726 RepID=A0A7X4WER0_9GAMM|nr:DUF2913 family protein [Photobacterium halotolerans]NAW66055.1 DUF2913 family protein [Photobacterium halotolerans]